MILTCISLMTNYAKHLYMRNSPFEDLFWRNIYSSPLPIFYLDCLSFPKAVRVFYVFWILKANQIYYFQMFLPPLFFFHFLDNILCCT